MYMGLEHLGSVTSGDPRKLEGMDSEGDIFERVN